MLLREGEGQVTPLRAWSAAERRHLAELAHEAQRAWEAAWCPEVVPEARRWAGGVRCEPAPRAGVAWRAQGGVEGVWWAQAPEGGAESPAALMERLLFGEAAAGQVSGPDGDAPGSTSLAAETAVAAWSDWWVRLEAALGGKMEPQGRDAARAEEEAQRPWSGAIVLEVPLRGTCLLLLVASARVRRCVRRDGATDPGRPAASPGASVWAAVAHRRAELRVLLDPFELDLGTLASLRVGDVLSTAHALEAPLVVELGPGEGATSTRLGLGHLGRLGCVAAVELLRGQEGACPS